MLRRSVGYLYLKAYLLSSLVTLFTATPLSSRLPARQRRKLLNLNQQAFAALPASSQPPPPRDVRPGSPRAWALLRAVQELEVRRSQQREQEEESDAAKAEHKRFRRWNTPSVKLSQRTTGADEVGVPEGEQPSGFLQRCGMRLKRWQDRAHDLLEVKALVARDCMDTKTYPEIEWDARVRRSNQLHEAEAAFLQARKRAIASNGALHSFLGLADDEVVHPDDIPTVALGGSGGGYRAMLGFAGTFDALKRTGTWDILTYVAGVSGSCWTMAAYYTIASRSSERLIEHFAATSHIHPMSRAALNEVARSSKGVYFILGPLLQKAKSGLVGLGVMDLYATMTTSYQFLSRAALRPRLSRASFQWSRVWLRAGIVDGREPMPILTAIRLARSDRNGLGPPPPEASHTNRNGNGDGASTGDGRGAAALTHDSSKGRNLWWQWFELSPIEVGSSDVGAWIPTWAFGRSFVSGRSLNRLPEQSLSLFLGLCTSAPAGPLTGYLSGLLASIPTGTIMSSLLSALNNFVMHKRWERRWGNPIRAADEPNFLYGHSTSELPAPSSDKGGTGSHSSADVDHGAVTHSSRWESAGRIKLMDSGMSNNLPNHVFCHPSRDVDVVLAFDASSDVQTGAALSRINDFGSDRGLDIVVRTPLAPLPPHPLDPAGRKDTDGRPLRKSLEPEEIDERFKGRYAQVLDGHWIGSALPSPRSAQQEKPDSDLAFVYCPLLPNSIQPGFDPATATFSTSYNLVWTPEQVQTIARTARANIEYKCVDTFRRVIREAYERRKARRLAAERDTPAPSGTGPEHDIPIDRR